MAHVPAATLARLWRDGQPFPEHGEPLWHGHWNKVLARGPYQAIPLHGNAYVRFRCTACGSSIFVANTSRGIRHATRVALGHQGACCKERQEHFRAHRAETAWPDPEEES
jgi:hypothetical protein